MVEWKKMWELTAWDKKFQGVDKSMQSKIFPYTYLLAKDLFALAVPNGNVKLLSTGVQEGWTTEELAGEYISEGEVVTIPWGKSPGAQNPVKYYKGKFVTGDNRIATSLDTNVLNNKFLYYWMYSKSEVIESFYRGAGIQHPSMFKVLTMPVPLLSLSEQQRIVDFLDTFTSAIDNLKEQIAQRRKQYEYYRDQLLDLEGKPGVEMKTLGEVCEVYTGGEVPNNTIKGQLSATEEYPYAVYANGKDTYGYSNTYQIAEDAVCISSIGANTGAVFYKKGKFTPAIRLKVLIPKDGVITKYLFYASSKIDFRGKNTGSVPNINANYVKNKHIPLPPLQEQQHIVSILDTFEASIANLEAQLKEREKQYEYYRNKLLTFE